MIALCTIVKNEEPVIQRMLESAEPYVDAYFILDTGSEDKTPEIIEQWLTSHKGKLERGTFEGFATSRNKSLEMVPEEYEYVLVLDADEVIVNFNKEVIRDADVYGIYVKSGEFAILGSRVFKRFLRYEREIHNEIKGHKTSAIIDPSDAYFNHLHDGKRSKDPNKIKSDIKTLSKTNSVTDKFYLAMSYYGMGERRESMKAFAEITALDYSDFSYMAHFMMGKMYYEAGFFDLAFLEFMDAYSYAKTMEAGFFIIKIAKLYNRKKLVNRQFNGTVKNVYATHIIPEIRDYLFDREFAETMSGVDKKKAKEVFEKILKKNIPQNIRSEVQKNIVSLS